MSSSARISTSKLKLSLFRSSSKLEQNFANLYEVNEEPILVESTAVTYEAKSKDTNETYHVKVVTKKVAKKEHLMSGPQLREIEIMTDLYHPNVVRYYESFSLKTKWILVFESLQGQTILDYAMKKALYEKYTEDDALRAIAQVASAIEYIHERKIVHRDIKTDNIRLVKYGDQTCLKLTNFRYATYFDDTKPTLTGVYGSWAFVCPEMLQNKEYDSSPDLWSLGIITYFIIGGAPPFSSPDKNEMKQLILKNKFYFPKNEWSNVSSECTDFIKSLLKLYPENRPRANELKSSPWFLRLKKEKQEIGLKGNSSYGENETKEQYSDKGLNIGEKLRKASKDISWSSSISDKELRAAVEESDTNSTDHDSVLDESTTETNFDDSMDI